MGRLDDAERHLLESLALKREVGNLIGEAETTVYLAELHRVRGEYAEALELHRQALDISGSGAHKYGECMARNSFAVTLRLVADVSGARDQHRQALALALEMRNRLAEGRALAGLAELAVDADRAEAFRLWREAWGIFEELGVPERHAVRARLDQDG